MVMSVTSLDNFVSKTRHLLNLERQAEEEQYKKLLSCKTVPELCGAGVAITKLHVVSVRTGLGGDIVDISFSSKYGEVVSSGTVAKVVENGVTVSCDQWGVTESDVSHRTFFMILAVNDVTFKRLQRCVDFLEKYADFQGRSLVECLFGEHVLFFASPVEGELELFDSNLNDPQKDAVKFATNSNRLLSMIHGPPGTGKTRTVVEIVRQIVKQGQKVLVCAPSNVAVDNLVERLAGNVKLVRLGHPARSNPLLRKYTLDATLARGDHAEILADIRKEMEELISGKRSSKPGRGREIGTLRKELHSREKDALSQVLSQSEVVCATLTSSGPDSHLRHLKNKGFDVAVIDECAQGMEIACWLALLQAKRAVVAGDHCQLPPTVISEDASKQGLSRTLMGRVEEELATKKEETMRLLTLQYRMNSHIMDWASREMYQGRLQADPLVSQHRLRDLVEDGEKDEDLLSKVLWLIDTEGCDMGEIVTADDDSKGNPGEVKLAFIHVVKLIELGLNPEDIAIISPYNLQVQLLRSHLHSVYPGIAIRSVDGFQGQEREAVILSLVRSNRKGEVGFLNDRRRINVAVTRARRHLAVIGDTGTINNDPFLKSLLLHIENSLFFIEELDALPFTIDMSDFVTVADSTDKKEKPQRNSERNTLSNRNPADKTDKNVVKNKATIKTGTSDIVSSTSVDNFGSKTHSGSERPQKINNWEDELTAQVLSFSDRSAPTSKAGQIEYEFSPNLDARQRHFVHELAESLQLQHYSKGEGAVRRIVISRLNPEQEETNVIHNISETTKQQTKVEAINTQASGKRVNTKSQQKADNCSQKKTMKEVDNPSPPIDFDQIVDQFAKEESRCKFPKCKQSVVMLGQRCRHCIQMFCLAHSCPEIHGCGHAAHVAARREVAKRAEGVTAPSKLKDEKRKHLERKMEKKLKDLEDERKAKTSAKKKT